jgi:hypothetical protein
MSQKDYECREREVEEWKQSWDEVFMDEVKRERQERGREGVKEREREKEREEREGKEREKVKCHKMFGDRKE